MTSFVRGDLVSYKGQNYYFQPKGKLCYLYQDVEDFGCVKDATHVVNLSKISEPWGREVPPYISWSDLGTPCNCEKVTTTERVCNVCGQQFLAEEPLICQLHERREGEWVRLVSPCCRATYAYSVVYR